ncbi:histidine kinase [Paenibacillus sp. FSL E2-0201]|uniref:sensor histidine kinase n=1 Tax=Paenibacillus sp. FSL E2-0201 TaxID=2954726 RepID=UPI0030D91D91
MTLRIKMILAFCIITLPLVCFLLYTNYYSSQVVREQVANYNSALLTLYGDQIDQTLDNDNSYLYRLANQEPDIRSLVYNLDNEDEYTLTRVAVINKMYADFSYNSSFYLNFVYIPFNEDLIAAQITQKSYEESVQIQNYLSNLFSFRAKDSSLSLFENSWRHCRIGDEQFLLRIVETDTNTYVGALIKSDDLMVPLQLISEERHMKTFMLDSKGGWLTSTPPDAWEEVTAAIQKKTGLYQTVVGKDKYLLVHHQMRLSDLGLAAMIPEKVMLQQVPLFQRISFAIPFAAGAILLILLIYFQKLVIKPIHHLIKGMRLISKGNLDTRLSTDLSHEFSLISGTFNNMASQIQDLKIHVYEEEIRSHKAELKQLQLQINPHFLFNSLNIIYNLAETKRFQLIQKMSSHLVDYLRFFARLREPLISIRDEMDNIGHYMGIQKLRFPKHLEYEYAYEETLGEFQIPPLTIQPFVENALNHGFATGKDVFRVHVQVYGRREQEQDYCEIRIADNGKAFPAELVEHFSAVMEDRSFTNEHIGIWNVFNRLKMVYQEEAQLMLSNLEPHGACVTIRIPIRSREHEGGEFRNA